MGVYLKPKEIIVEVNEDGQWIFEDQKNKNRAWSPFMPIYDMAGVIASKLGIKRKWGKTFKFKITKVE